MRKLYHSFLFIFCLLLLAVSSIDAQSIIKGGKQVLSTFSKSSSKVTNIASKVKPNIVTGRAKVASSSVNIPTSNPRPYNSFVTKNKTTLFSLQRAIGISPIQAGRNLQKWGAAPSVRPPLPKPQGDPFFVEDLSSLIPPTQSDKGPIPVENNPQLIFRGMALDAPAIKNILEKGMLLKDVSDESTTLRLAYASKTMHVPTLHNITTTPLNNLTESPKAAAAWASKRLPSVTNATVVVVSVKSYERGSIIVIPTDILPDRFYDVLAVLQVNGKPTWCKIELAENGYKVTPYKK